MARKIRKTLKSGGRKLKTRGRNLKSKRRTSKLGGKKINKTKGNKKNRKHLRGGDRYKILTLKKPIDLYDAINMGYNEYYKNNELELKLKKYPKYPDKDMRNIWTEERQKLLDIKDELKNGENTYNAIRGQANMQELHILDMDHFINIAKSKLFGKPANVLFKKYGVESNHDLGTDTERLVDIDLNNVTSRIRKNPRDKNVPYFIGIKENKGNDFIGRAYDNFTTAKNSAEQRIYTKAQKRFGDLKDKANQKFGYLKNKISGTKSQLTNSEKTPLLVHDINRKIEDRK